VKRVRGGAGIGDGLYVHAICRYLISKGVSLEVATRYYELFQYLPVKIAPFSRQNIDYLAHYVSRKGIPGTTQFQDACLASRINEPVDLKMDWPKKKTYKTDKPVVCVSMIRPPMDRTDGAGMEILPPYSVMQDVIDILKPHCYIVQIGKGKSLYKLRGIDLDLSNATSVTGMIDAVNGCDAVFGYCSYLLPLAECLDKPGLFVWGDVSKSKFNYVRNIIPEKIIHKKNLIKSVYCYEDYKGAASTFCQSLTR
jgi:hypothetical protein